MIDFSTVSKYFEEYDPVQSTRLLAGLFVSPKHHPYHLRIETLLGLALTYSRGVKTPTRETLDIWGNAIDALHPIWHLDDPPEDSFVYGVMSRRGNYRVFQGLTEGDGWLLQDFLDLFLWQDLPPVFNDALEQTEALLGVSTVAAQRLGLARWSTSEDSGPFCIPIPSDEELTALADAVTFGPNDLVAAGIQIDRLLPHAGNLDTRPPPPCPPDHHLPLLATPSGDIVLAFPGSTAEAIRQLWMTTLERNSLLDEFHRRLKRKHADLVFNESRVGKPEAVSVLTPAQLGQKTTVSGAIDDLVFRVDGELYCHIVLVHEDLRPGRWSSGGAPREFKKYFRKTLARRLREVRRAVIAQSPSSEGLTVIVFHVLGRPLALSLPPVDPPWEVLNFSVHDFEVLADSKGFSFLRLWRLAEQRRRAIDAGIRFPALTSDFSLYSWWILSDFSVVPEEFPLVSGSTLAVYLPPSFALNLRLPHYRRWDQHSIFFPPRGQHIPTKRVIADSYFPSLAEQPIFGSIVDALAGRLVGAVEHTLLPSGNPSQITWWVGVSKRPDSGPQADAAYKLWEALWTWLMKLGPLFEEATRPTESASVVIELSFEFPDWWSSGRPPELKETPTPSGSIRGSQNEQGISLRVLPGFFELARLSTNDSERHLALTCLDLAREHLQAILSDAPNVSEIVDQGMGGRHARSFHVFSPESSTGALVSAVAGRDPKFLPPETRAGSQWGLGWRCRTVEEGPFVEGMDCGKLLHSTVDALWKEVRLRLEALPLVPTLEKLLLELEVILADRQRWRMTTRAMVDLHGDREEVQQVAAEREVERAATANTNRVLIEMAACHAPRTDGEAPSDRVLDTARALTLRLIELGMISDGIRQGFEQASLRILPRGDITGAFGGFEAIAGGYRIATFDRQFSHHEAAVGTFYEQMTRASGEPSPQLTEEEATLSDTLAEELGLTLPEIFEVRNFLVGKAHELDTTVPHLKCSDLHSLQCAGKTAGFGVEALHKFLKHFSIWPRANWDRTPEGFNARDWYPWLSKRRLSLVYRPIIRLQEQVCGEFVFGAQQLEESPALLARNLWRGWLPQDFFRSAKARSLLGMRSEVLGGKFEEEVRSTVIQLDWDCRQMNMKALGAPDELGDVDAFCTRQSDDCIAVIEVKRLQPCFSASDMAGQFSEFRGENMDRLFRHVRRVEWIRANRVEVSARIGCPVSRVTSLVVMNAPQIIQFAGSVASQVDYVVDLKTLERFPEILTAEIPSEIEVEVALVEGDDGWQGVIGDPVPHFVEGTTREGVLIAAERMVREQLVASFLRGERPTPYFRLVPLEEET